MDDRTLKRGALIGSCMIVVVVFLFGFGGFIAAWSGLFQPSNRPYDAQSCLEDSPAVWMSMSLELIPVLCAAGPDDYGNTILFTLLSNGGPPVVRPVC